MHTRTTTAAAGLLTAGLLLTGCSSSSDKSTTPTPAPTTPTATYNPAAWKSRIDNLVTLMDQDQTECTVAPSSDSCADMLRAADAQVLEMKSAVDANGGAASHPQTADTLGKIIAGYNSYISGSCPGSDEADAQGSDCRVSMATVMLGVATLSSKMTLDGDQ